MKLVIVDYGVGNIGSISNMLRRIGVDAVYSSKATEIEQADKLILPGVGAFDAGMEHLERAQLIPILGKKVLEERTPILGICLGMQLLLNQSEEGEKKGLGWISGKCKKFQFDATHTQKLKVPHMGWNIVIPQRTDTLFTGLAEEPRFYFVHSYYAECDNPANILSTTPYGFDFASSIRKENILGVQFHPEKSHRFGMKLLKNFVEQT